MFYYDGFIRDSLGGSNLKIENKDICYGNLFFRNSWNFRFSVFLEGFNSES